jgi:amino acid transporter
MLGQTMRCARTRIVRRVILAVSALTAAAQAFGLAANLDPHQNPLLFSMVIAVVALFGVVLAMALLASMLPERTSV